MRLCSITTIHSYYYAFQQFNLHYCWYLRLFTKGFFTYLFLSVQITEQKKQQQKETINHQTTKKVVKNPQKTHKR